MSMTKRGLLIPATVKSNSIFEEGQLPHWRFRTLSGQNWQTRDVSLVTNRGKGTFSQVFDFVEKDGFMESTQAIPEPHSFEVRLTLGHRGHVHDYDVTFHEHEHEHSALEGLDASSKEYQDAHEKAHANDIKKRFANRNVTTGQIILFGLTGGLIPCPAAITVLLLCIQVKEFSLGPRWFYASVLAWQSRWSRWVPQRPTVCDRPQSAGVDLIPWRVGLPISPAC